MRKGLGQKKRDGFVNNIRCELSFEMRGRIHLLRERGKGIEIGLIGDTEENYQSGHVGDSRRCAYVNGVEL